MTLQGRVYADFRQPQAYFTAAFDLIVSVHDLEPRDPVIAELRQYVDGQSRLG